MNKKAAFTFRGMNQDITKSKASNEYYYEGNNIRVTATDSGTTGSVTNQKGNELAITIPEVTVDTLRTRIEYGDKYLTFTGATSNSKPELYELYEFNSKSGKQTIIGTVDVREEVIVFSTDNKGFDCIWKFDKKDNLELLYLRDLGFSVKNPIQAIFNYENDNINKIYWVDGKNQLRFINYKQSKERGDKLNLIDVPSSSINSVGSLDISQPYIKSISTGGVHTAGMIQYAYNLYNLNGTQTKISPLSPLVPLNKGNMGGGKVNETVGTSPVVAIDDIDKSYTHIKVYAIKYTSYNQIPSVSIIEDRALPDPNDKDKVNITVFDDGNVINDISLSEFLFLGSNPIVAKHIATKDNRLFLANLAETNFDVDLDTRAYSFSKYQNPRVYDIINTTETGITLSNYKEVKAPDYNLPEKHPAINGDYDMYRYQSNKIVEGGEGKYIKYELQTKNRYGNKVRTFKDNEIYRIGIQFYNRLGQVSFPKWIADFKAPEGNLEGKYTALKVTLKPEFYVWLNDSSNFESENDKPVGYKILRADRTEADKTIVTQGILGSMISNYKARDRTVKDATASSKARQRWRDGDKMPSLLRTFGDNYVQMRAMKDGNNLQLNHNGQTVDNHLAEVNRAKSESENAAAETYQFNRLMQLYSPEVMFGNVAVDQGLKLRIRGGALSKSSNFWGRHINVDNMLVEREGKALNQLTPYDSGGTDVGITGKDEVITRYGIIGPADHSEENRTKQLQFHRDFTKGFSASRNKGSRYEPFIYGSPEITERGQSATNYNNDPNFKYYNTLTPMMADGGDARGENSPAITSVNSYGAKCLTLAVGKGSKFEDKIPLERLHSSSGIPEKNCVLVAELVKNDAQIYAGNIYGGNSYEEKKRTNYVEIGDYQNISTKSIVIDNPGDTYVQNFRFARLAKTDVESIAMNVMQITELVEVNVETSIDLSNRSDVSFNEWDARFQPRYDEYHDYNRVYSQQANLIQNTDADFTFRKVDKFDTKIISTKIKVAGEVIDSWTDVLENETMELDGKYGPINNLISHRDQLFAFQDKGFAAIAVNPRVQVQDTTGLGIELGTGNVLHDYRYISTNSGSINKWGVISTGNALYYLDALNQSFYRFSDRLEKLSDTKGMHSWFTNNVSIDSIRLDNPVLGGGVSIGYDLFNNDIIISLHQPNSRSLVFNELTDSFVSTVSFCAPYYITLDDYFLSVSPFNNNLIYKHNIGKYNRFYGVYYPSYVTLLVNPDPNFQCVFDLVEFNSEMYIHDIDVSDKTINYIRAHNEYQDSGEVPLEVGRNKNLRRKFRTWRANIPRDGRNRIRNPWSYIQLGLHNKGNYKLVLHDVVVSYTVS